MLPSTQSHSGGLGCFSRVMYYTRVGTVYCPAFSVTWKCKQKWQNNLLVTAEVLNLEFLLFPQHVIVADINLELFYKFVDDLPAGSSSPRDKFGQRS